MTDFMLQNNGKIFLNDMVYQNVMKWSSKVKSLKLFYINTNQNTYKIYSVFMRHIMETEETYKAEHNKDDGDIGLFEWGQIGIVLRVLYKGIIIIKKLNIKRIIYKFGSEKIG